MVGYAYNNMKKRVKEYEERLEKIEALRDKYARHIGLVERGERPYDGLSEEERLETKSRIEEEKGYLDSYCSALSASCSSMTNMFSRREARGIDVTERESIDKSLTEEEENIKKAERDFKKVEQGKTSDIISSYLGNFDRRIHNFLYARNDARWEDHKLAINDRYTTKGLLKYAGTRAAGLLLANVLVLPAIVATSSIALPIVGTLATMAFYGYGAKVVGSIISTIYNRRKYGGPRLEKEYKLKKGFGSYGENLKIARNQKKMADNLMQKYSEAIENEVPVRTTTPPIVPPTPTDTYDMANLISRINACDLTNTNSDHIDNVLGPLYDEASAHEADLPDSIRTRYNELKEIVTRRRDSIVELQQIIEGINTCNLSDNSERNIHDLYALYIKAFRREADLPDAVRPRYDDLRAFVETNLLNRRANEEKARELQEIVNNLNTCNLADTSERNIRNLYALYVKAFRREADLPDAVRSRYDDLKTIVEAYLREVRRRANSERELQQIIEDINTCDLNDNSERNIHDLTVLYNNARSRLAELPASIRPAFLELEKAINAYTHDEERKQNRESELQKIVDNINACVLTDTSDDNMRSLFLLYNQAKTREADLPASVLARYGDLKVIADAYLKNARIEGDRADQLRQIIEDIESCVLTDTSKDNLQHLQEVYNNAKTREADLPDSIRSRYDRIGKIVGATQQRVISTNDNPEPISPQTTDENNNPLSSKPKRGKRTTNKNIDQQLISRQLELLNEMRKIGQKIKNGTATEEEKKYFEVYSSVVGLLSSEIEDVKGGKTM